MSTENTAEMRLGINTAALNFREQLLAVADVYAAEGDDVAAGVLLVAERQLRRRLSDFMAATVALAPAAAPAPAAPDKKKGGRPRKLRVHYAPSVEPRSRCAEFARAELRPEEITVDVAAVTCKGCAAALRQTIVPGAVAQ